MDWKLLFNGLGAVWFLGCGAAAIAGWDNDPAMAKAVFGFGIFGFLIGLVVAAACPKKK